MVPKLLKFHVNQTTRFRDIDVGSWPFVFAIRHCHTSLPYFVAVLCSARYGTVLTIQMGRSAHTWRCQSHLVYDDFQHKLCILFDACLPTLIYRRSFIDTYFKLIFFWQKNLPNMHFSSNYVIPTSFHAILKVRPPKPL